MIDESHTTKTINFQCLIRLINQKKCVKITSTVNYIFGDTQSVKENQFDFCESIFGNAQGTSQIQICPYDLCSGGQFGGTLL